MYVYILEVNSFIVYLLSSRHQIKNSQTFSGLCNTLTVGHPKFHLRKSSLERLSNRSKSMHLVNFRAGI